MRTPQAPHSPAILADRPAANHLPTFAPGAADAPPASRRARMARLSTRIARPGSAGASPFQRIAMHAFPTNHYLLPTTHSRPRRAGISLLEVLISMFVLLFGLLGVASIFPVGNHYAGRGDQYDRASALSEAAFAEVTARGLLNPQSWYYALPSAAPLNGKGYNGTNYLYPASDPKAGQFNVPWPLGNGDPSPGYVLLFDPMGSIDPPDSGDMMPSFYDLDTPNVEMPPEWADSIELAGYVPGITWPIRRLTLVNPAAATTPAQVATQREFARSLVHLHDDLTVELPKESDRPGIQRWRTDNNGTPDDQTDDVLLARSYSAAYSWLATIVPRDWAAIDALQRTDRLYGTALYDVSVALFHKREVEPSTTSERLINVAQNGGELVVYDVNNDPTMVDAALEDIRPGQWIAIAGIHPQTGQFLLKWCRLSSVEDDTETKTDQNLTNGSGNFAVRRASIEDPPAEFEGTPNLRAILMPGVISVTTRTVPMQGN